MDSLAMLRQQAAAMGITEVEARKYGDIRHRRTWSIAIEHHQSQQPNLDRPELATVFEEKVESQNLESAMPGTQKPPLSFEAIAPPPPIQSPATPLESPQTEVIPQEKQQAHRFAQVVQNHIKALRKSSLTASDPTRSSIRNWLCPECNGKGFNCHLCQGAGHADDIVVAGWTLAYLELLGCSPQEIAPFRNFSEPSLSLELSLEACIAIKKTNEILSRTEKWVKK